MKKKWKFGLKVADSHSEPGNLQKRGNFHFFIIFYHFFFILSFFFIFLARGTWNPGKPWKTMKNNGKPSKTKENEKKWSCKWKKMKIWTQSCRFSLRTRKSSKTRGNVHFFFILSFFSFSLPVAPEIQESHENQWKTMENHQKQRKMKKNEVANEKKWSCKWKKMKIKWNKWR